MLTTITTTVSDLSRLPLIPLNSADTYSMSSTNFFPFQTNIKLNATANPGQTLCQPHAAPNEGSSATLLSSSSTVNSKNPFTVISQNYTVLFLQ